MPDLTPDRSNLQNADQRWVRNIDQDFVVRRGFFVGQRLRRSHAYKSREGKENTVPKGLRYCRRRARRSPLPSWYPRTPLRDVTAIVNALERRRLKARTEVEGRTRNSENEYSVLSPTPIVSSIPDQSNVPLYRLPVPENNEPNTPTKDENPTTPIENVDNKICIGSNSDGSKRRLVDSLELIEKAAFDNMKKMTHPDPDAKWKTQMKILRSMR